MALVWITCIKNMTQDRDFVLWQSDPTKHPVIDHTDMGGYAIYDGNGTKVDTNRLPDGDHFLVVQPNTILRTSWFVIPWAVEGEGSWVVMEHVPTGQPPVPTPVIASADGGVRCHIETTGGGGSDFIAYYKRNYAQINGPVGTNPSVTVAATQPAGGAGFLSSTSGDMVLADGSLYYAITSSNSAGQDAAAIATFLFAAAQAAAPLKPNDPKPKPGFHFPPLGRPGLHGGRPDINQ